MPVARTESTENPGRGPIIDPRSTFEAAEQRLFERYGIAPVSRYVAIERPRLRIRVIEVGAGPSVLMVHGGGGFVSLWAPLLAKLHGFRLVAIDRPGHGLTDRFDYRGVDQRRHAVEFLTSVIEALGLEGAPVVANSMGGLWSLWLAIERPDLVSRLALLGWPAMLMNTSAPLPMRVLAVRGIGARMMAAETPSPQQARNTFVRMGHGAVVYKLPAELFECFAAGEAIPGYAAAYQSLLNGILRLRGARPGMCLDRDQLRNISQPVLLVVGRKDPFTKPAITSRAPAAFVQARLVSTDGGHLPWLDDPALCASALNEFLA
jgi:pimeloyl-ACP methyl ester carboxylesterase